MNDHMGPRTQHTRRRVLLAAAPIAVMGSALGAACAMGTTGAPPKNPAELSGTIDIVVQDFGPTVSIHTASIESFKQVAPNVKINYTTVSSGDPMAAKARTTAASGAGPDVIQTYTDYWRGVDAATVFLPLTPQLMSRKEAEQIAVPTLLDSVWSKKREVYVIPQAVGVNGSHLQYNAQFMSAAGIDPKRLTSMDSILEAAVKLVQRNAQDVTRAGLLPTEATTCIYNWILDQGGKFYDEKTNKWSWQTAEAERSFQWLLDLYDKHRVAWRTAPAGTTSAMGQGRAAAQLVGPYSISGLWQQFPEMTNTLLDQPLPAFTAGKSPNYFLTGFSGLTITAALKPDDVKARIGAAYLKHTFSAENRLKTQANDYSGAILNYAVYADPKFKETRYGAIRGQDFVEKVIKRTVIMNPAAMPGPGPQWTKVLGGELGIKAALAELQQIHQQAEDEALRARGG
jgi:ABC-type glycerol-3-phosphate transport system substrate-binding protein